MSTIEAGTTLPINDTVLFTGGPMDQQRLRIPFGKPRTVECGIPVGNQVAIYAPHNRGDQVVFNFVNIVNKL